MVGMLHEGGAEAMVAEKGNEGEVGEATEKVKVGGGGEQRESGC